MGIVAILLVNMLIAMMGNTYQKIAETRNEWQRQVRRKHVPYRDVSATVRVGFATLAARLIFQI